MNLEQARFNMIQQQIRPWNVLDEEVLHLLSVVRREDFVPLAHKALAFADVEIALGSGQTMLAPRVEARLLQDAAAQRHEKVLEVGAGSGFMAALLAHRAQRVITLEIEPELARMAAANLARAGVHNAEVRQQDGAAGSATDGPFDLILLSGSVPEVPAALLSQLKVGGRLLAIVGSDPMMRVTRITRGANDQFESRTLWDTVAARLRNFPDSTPFGF